MPQGTPTDEVIDMQQRGEDDADVISYLTKKGYTADQISEAMNLARIKTEVSEKKRTGNVTGLTPSILGREEGEEAPAPEEGYEEQAQAPAPQQQEYASYEEQPQQQEYAPRVDTETIEEIAEEIVNEKWEEVKEKIEEVIEWKDYTEKRLKSFEDRIKRTELSLDNLQVALIGKIQAYGDDIKNLGKEMQSLEGAFSKVLSPLVTNVKEIDRIAGKVREKREEKVKGKR